MSDPKADAHTGAPRHIITAHPNPTDDVLYVTVTDGEITRVEMFDMFGRDMAVRANNHSPQQTLVNTSALPSGVYLLRVTLTDGTVRTAKVVKD